MQIIYFILIVGFVGTWIMVQPLDIRHAYPGRLAAVCQEAPVTWRRTEIRRYQGVVIARPEGPGVLGAAAPRALALPVHTAMVQASGEALPLVIAGRPGRNDPQTVAQFFGPLAHPGDTVHFCGIPRGRVSWWPQTGYRAGLFGGPIYGQPAGSYREVQWLIDVGPSASKE